MPTTSKPTRTARTSAGGASLELYLSEVRRHALLPQEAEAALARRGREGDEDALNELVTRNLRFVVSVAKKYRGCGLPLEDLISEGNVGLLTAARKFDPERGVRFISYAVWWIRQTIHVALARQGHVVRVPVSRAADLRALGKAREMLRQHFGREPTVAEVSGATGLSAADIETLSGLGTEDLSLDAPRGDEGSAEWIDSLAQPEDRNGEGAEIGMIEQIQSAVAALPPREGMIVRLNYGMDGEDAQSLEAIGAMLGITRERVRQIRERALRRIKRGASAQVLSSFAA